jgi:LEA14-like dessication related protein
MNKNASFWMVIALIIIGFVACKKPINPEFRGIESINVYKISGDESQVSGNAKFYNPNSFKLELRHAEVNVYLNDKLSGHCVIDSTIYIPKLDSFYVPVSFTINLQSIFSNALQMLVSGKVKITGDGSVDLRKSGLGFNIPVHFEQFERLDSLIGQVR